MKPKYLFFSFLFIIGGFVTTVTSASGKLILLEPVLQYSFCTPWMSGYTLGIVGDNWALELSFPKNGFSGNVLAQEARLHRGPNIRWYIRKSAGPVTPPIPATDQYSMLKITGITVNINRIKIFDGVMGPIEVVVEDFSADGKIFHVSNPVTIVCIGPLP